MTKQLVILLPVILVTATLALVFIRSFVAWKFYNRRIKEIDIELGDLDKYPDSKPQKELESKAPVRVDPRSRKKLRWK